jgi:hypothetical protein
MNHYLSFMKLRFEVDQAEAFRKGIDAPNSIVTIEVDPSPLPPDIRKLIADRLFGIEVCQLVPMIPPTEERLGTIHMVARKREPVRIIATGVTFGDMMTAIRKNEDALGGHPGCRLFLDEKAVPHTHGSLP